jgi:hypothetical protein
MGDVEPSPPGDRLYLDKPYVSVRWESGGPWVLAEWKAWANSTEYRAAHEEILGVIREHHAPRFLIDARNARVVSEQDQEWINTNWIPRAVAAGRRWTAVVMPTSALVKTIVENIDRHPTSGTVGVRYFDTVDQARAWLSAVS